MQYLAMNYNGKEYEKEYIYIYKLNHFAVYQNLTQHCQSTILKLKKKKLHKYQKEELFQEDVSHLNSRIKVRTVLKPRM